ncbi:hypothetical protein AOQ84DRAFT_387981 [Glonium stellatum]|uniref:Adhesin domain-containing protein n=1 Tax=Glonium stellatum TaxID=574774 RepID=A0A8E2F3C1_9PEZI|nr:hypothetical protein AOQ84DRAFT_387981 [Glonium stellatum]
MTIGPYHDDSDSASFSDELSPTDGYFSHREHPRDRYMDTASLPHASQPKAREAEAENRMSRPSRSSRSPRTPLSSVNPDETTPLVNANQPPPAYFDATANPYQGYAAEQNEGSRDEVVRNDPGLLLLTSRRSPQHMGDSPSHYPERYGNTYYDHSRKRIHDCCSSSRFIKITLVICAVAIAVWLVGVLTPHESLKEDISKGFPDWPEHCDHEYYIKTASFDFDNPGTFGLHELVTQHDRTYKTVFGKIHVAKGPDDQKPNTRAQISFATPKSIEIEKLKYTKSETELFIEDPVIKNSKNINNPTSLCLGIEIILYVAPGVKLENLKIRSKHLGVEIHEGAEFSVSNQTDVALISGSLHAHTFRSRKTTIDIISGSVSGTYALRDLLSIKTRSGSINVDVQPKEADKEHPAPAVFWAGSMAGSIKVRFETFAIPSRDYQTTVDGNMGSLAGTFIHGSSTDLKTTSGSITVDITPYEASASPFTLRTFSMSGRTAVDLRSPYKNPRSAISNLTSSHKTHSGSLHLTYPPEWEGKIEGGTHSGSLHLRGKGVEIIREGEGFPFGRTVKAKKGEGDSLLEFSTMSGSCDITIGLT